MGNGAQSPWFWATTCSSEATNFQGWLFASGCLLQDLFLQHSQGASFDFYPVFVHRLLILHYACANPVPAVPSFSCLLEVSWTSVSRLCFSCWEIGVKFQRWGLCLRKISISFWSDLKVYDTFLADSAQFSLFGPGAEVAECTACPASWTPSWQPAPCPYPCLLLELVCGALVRDLCWIQLWQLKRLPFHAVTHGCMWRTQISQE